MKKIKKNAKIKIKKTKQKLEKKIFKEKKNF